MIITISGDIGSGKSTVGKLYAKKAGINYLSTGAIQRKIAEEMKLTTLELNLLTEKVTEIDDKIDSYTKALEGSSEDYVIDSRLAWHFVPSSYKVYLRCKQDIAAQRIFKDMSRKSDEETNDMQVLLTKIQERRDSEKRRFYTKYQVDFSDLTHYDLVIDSSYFTPQEIVNMIFKGIEFYYPKI